MLDPTLSDWLDRQADALDRGDADPAALLPRLAAAHGKLLVDIPVG
ncbi:acyl-CoA dehydrogenase, partial [Pseudomonas aeruginosa]|nr:acyl-CoA dehydrogenase [Pseudomonas aeruginosa]